MVVRQECLNFGFRGDDISDPAFPKHRACGSDYSGWVTGAY